MIRVENLCVSMGAFSLEGITFEIETGDYAVLMGRTGSGKTTILEAVCGLRPIRSGDLTLMGRRVTRARPAERGVGYVPQECALFSCMNIREHLAFALRIRKQSPQEIERRVDDLAELLGIRHLLDRFPHGLSGGEAQRVALGRALSHSPGILCLDEPLSALDDETRDEMYALLKSVQRQTHVTTLHVTHNISEARRLADRVLVLKDGKVRPADEPLPIRS